MTATRLPVCLLLLHRDLNLAHEMGHGCSRIFSQLAWAFRMLSILQCLSSCLSTSSLSSTLATNHCKGSQLFIVGPDRAGPTYLSGCSPQAFRLTFSALSEFLLAQSFITVPCCHFSKYQWQFLCVTRIYQAQRCTKTHITTDWKTTVKSFKLELFL